MKEALHIQMTPSEERFNRDGGLEVPGCWTAVMRRQGGRSNPHRPLTSLAEPDSHTKSGERVW